MGDPFLIGYEAGPEVGRAHVARKYREERGKVQILADALRDQGIDATTLLVQGPIVVTTPAQAEKLGADLIVVGSHRHEALYDVLIGSSSAGVLRAAKVPVPVVPTRQ